MSEFEYEVQGFYGHGWETLTTEDTKAAALEQKHVYDVNETQYPHRVRRVRSE